MWYLHKLKVHLQRHAKRQATIIILVIVAGFHMIDEQNNETNKVQKKNCRLPHFGKRA